MAELEIIELNETTFIVVLTASNLPIIDPSGNTKRWYRRIDAERFVESRTTSKGRLIYGDR
jgi:hypothetical protein